MNASRVHHRRGYLLTMTILAALVILLFATLLARYALIEQRQERLATLESYAQFPDSHCLNGGVIRVRDGRRLMDSLVSHHYLLLVGHHAENIRWLGKVFGLTVKEL